MKYRFVFGLIATIYFYYYVLFMKIHKIFVEVNVFILFLNTKKKVCCFVLFYHSHNATANKNTCYSDDVSQDTATSHIKQNNFFTNTHTQAHNRASIWIKRFVVVDRLGIIFNKLNYSESSTFDVLYRPAITLFTLIKSAINTLKRVNYSHTLLVWCYITLIDTALLLSKQGFNLIMSWFLI